MAGGPNANLLGREMSQKLSDCSLTCTYVILQLSMHVFQIVNICSIHHSCTLPPNNSTVVLLVPTAFWHAGTMDASNISHACGRLTTVCRLRTVML